MKPDTSRKVDLDDAIDRAVRSMMSAEPRPGMRQRVLSRLHERPSRAFPFLRVAIAGVSIAAIALAVALRVGIKPIDVNEPVAAPPQTMTTPPRQQTPVAAAAPNAAPVPVPETARPVMRSQPVARGLVVAQSLMANEEEDSIGAAAIETPGVSPELDPLQVRALPLIQELASPANTIAPITVPPLVIPELPVITPIQGPIH